MLLIIIWTDNIFRSENSTILIDSEIVYTYILQR